MDKNQKYLPIAVLIGIIVLIVLVVLIKNFAPDTVKRHLSAMEGENTEYVDLGSGDPLEGSFEDDASPSENEQTNEKIQYENTATDSKETEPTSLSHSDTQTTYVDDETEQDGLTKDSAWVIDLNTEYVATMVRDYQKHWFVLFTTDKDVIYRVFIDPDVNDSYIMESIEIAVYDEIGIKVQEETTSYGNESFFDIFLTPNTKYYIRVYAKNFYQSSGDYMMWVQEMPRDPATVTEKEAAFPMEIGQEYVGTLNSSFSNWYSCVFTEGGQYSLVIHNIDVGCTMYIKERASERQSLFSGYVENENSNAISFEVDSGDKICIEISPGQDTANGRYILKVE